MTTLTRIPRLSYPTLIESLQTLSLADRNGHYRNLIRGDLYFLLRFICQLDFMDNDWYWSRCWEVQESPNGHLDLWSREHGKSLVITFGKTIQDILRSHGEDPIDANECTIGIFSHTRPIAKAFLSQIARELETNEPLKQLFPDILYANPKSDAPRWSLDGGIVVKRNGNPKESTVDAWGLVDGQPTSKHYTHLIYDDVVTLESVTTPEMVKKTTDALAISYNLGDARSGVRRFIGTRYHFNDTYKTILDRGTALPRIYPATVDGSFTGEPVLWTREMLEGKIRDMGPYVAACQLMQNPKSDESQGFRREWINFFENRSGAGMNIYITVDPANSKKKNSDFTAMWVWGLAADNNYYWLDAVRDRMSLHERAKALFYLHRKWKPKLVGYERYGVQADIDHIRGVMEADNYRFNIVELAGKLSKEDRIKRLVPLFADGRVYFPHRIDYTGTDGRAVELVETFINDEYMAFPVSTNDDMIDAASRIFDLDVSWPKLAPETTKRYSRSNSAANWMSA